MSGIQTTNTQHLIRSEIWTSRIKEQFDADLFAMKYVDMLTEFPDGDVFNIPSIGDPEVYDYEEGQAIRYTALDTGNFTFSITDYKASATYISNKFKQDSFYAQQVESRFVPKQSRVIAEAMESAALAIGPDGQTANDPNSINGAGHRFVGRGQNGSIAPEDFAAAKYALQKANVPTTNLIAIVDPSVEFTLSTMTNLVNVSYNPHWEGIVRDGIASGMRFKMNIYGFDVYISNWLKKGVNETIAGRTTTTGVANLFFTTEADANPFIGAVRQSPQVDSDYNKDFQREEYVTTARYGFGFYREESVVVGLTNVGVVE